MKLKLKSTKTSKPDKPKKVHTSEVGKWPQETVTESKDSLSSLGTLEELRDPKHLVKQRVKYRKNDAIEGYCELLETQINSLVKKLLPLHEEHIKLKKDHLELCDVLDQVYGLLNKTRESEKT